MIRLRLIKKAIREEGVALLKEAGKYYSRATTLPGPLKICPSGTTPRTQDRG